MQITLNHDEILEALDAYVRTQIAIAPGQQVTIDLKAGRGENGFSATLDIVPAARSKTVIPAPSQSTSQSLGCSDAPGGQNLISPPAALTAPKSNPFAKAAAKSQPETQEAPETAEEGDLEADEAETQQEATAAPEAAEEAPAAAPNPRSVFSKLRHG